MGLPKGSDEANHPLRCLRRLTRHLPSLTLAAVVNTKNTSVQEDPEPWTN
ncbi:hypothetical protein [Lyngbya aestuarii]